MPDWSSDLVLRALQDLDEPVGTLIRAFPGRAGLADDTEWLSDWFIDLTRRFAADEGPDPSKIVASAAEDGDLSLLAKPPVEAAIHLVSITPTYFRGFRGAQDPILFEASLVVVEGRNSSGKTSISEAIEWVFTGQLSRRSSGEHGHPTELADCIANEFRPDDEETSVEITLTVDGEPLALRRVLTRDYSTTASEAPESVLYVDGNRVSREEEHSVRDRLLAGVHPILMQHNLRRFVHDDPKSRRQYFERLLQIDELTALVEKAVIGPKRLREIENPDGGTGLAALRALVAEIERDPESPATSMLAELRKFERLDAVEVPDALRGSLLATARSAFAETVRGAKGLSEVRDLLTTAQREQREERLPLLSELERARSETAPDMAVAEEHLRHFKEAVAELAVAQTAAAEISAAQQEIARVAKRLIATGLLDLDTTEDQICALCNADPASLTPQRVAEITTWTPLASALGNAEQTTQEAKVRAEQALGRVRAAAAAVIPSALQPKQVEAQLAAASQRVRALAETALESASKAGEAAKVVTDSLDTLVASLGSQEVTPEAIEAAEATIASNTTSLNTALAVHREDVSHLEEAVGAASRDDAAYRLRERWLELAGLTSGVAEDVVWEGAKARAKKALDSLRTGLIALRTEIIEDARRTFSTQMTEVWKLLRSDSGAQFSRLRIPAPSGRGYKLELELKAVISDGKADSEVDALRVFSESQVNVIGLAAYITRAQLLGHKLLIFDDPVQSMDEEHFRSFAAGLLPALLERGFQVVILTHSETFARRIHDHHYRRDSYATLETKPSRRRGCYVEEGNRRVSERLKNAVKRAADGDLEGGWILVRLAIERLYTLAYARENEEFKPESWRNLTAEDMWERGVGDIVSQKAPEMSERLREILKATVAGAHDKAATSETELVNASKDLKGLLDPLRVGAG